jgi:hypothetical protein
MTQSPSSFSDPRLFQIGMFNQNYLLLKSIKSALDVKDDPTLLFIEKKCDKNGFITLKDGVTKVKLPLRTVDEVLALQASLVADVSLVRDLAHHMVAVALKIRKLRGVNVEFNANALIGNALISRFDLVCLVVADLSPGFDLSEYDSDPIRITSTLTKFPLNKYARQVVSVHENAVDMLVQQNLYTQNWKTYVQFYKWNPSKCAAIKIFFF